MPQRRHRARSIAPGVGVAAPAGCKQASWPSSNPAALARARAAGLGRIRAKWPLAGLWARASPSRRAPIASSSRLPPRSRPARSARLPSTWRLGRPMLPRERLLPAPVLSNRVVDAASAWIGIGTGGRCRRSRGWSRCLQAARRSALIRSAKGWLPSTTQRKPPPWRRAATRAAAMASEPARAPTCSSRAGWRS